GGTEPYTYSVDNSPFTSNTFYNDIASGSHKVVVMDANGCTFEVETIVGTAAGPNALEVIATPAGCTNPNGTLTIGAVGGGTEPYTYSIDDGPFSSNVSYPDIAPGVHTVAVMDANGCIFEVEANIGTVTTPTAAATATDPTCADPTAGTLTVTAPLGSEYSYSIDGNN